MDAIPIGRADSFQCPETALITNIKVTSHDVEIAQASPQAGDEAAAAPPADERRREARQRLLGPPMNFEPVRTKADLDTLNHAEIVEGYMSASSGDPEPGPNRGRAYWHGWRVRMMDFGEIEIDDAARALVHEVAPNGVYRR